MTKQVPNRIKELRKQAGLSQQELSEKVGVIRKTISNWERGCNRVSPEHAESLAKYFNVSIGYLLGVSDRNRSTHSDLSQWVAAYKVNQ